MYGVLDISTSGMIAQRVRLTVSTTNIANAGSYTIGEDGQPQAYRARRAHFTTGDPSARGPARELGVHVSRIEIAPGPPMLRWDPGDPFCYKSGPLAGYVPITDVNPVTERVNGLEALRAYEANVAAAEATKTMMAQALRLLA